MRIFAISSVVLASLGLSVTALAAEASEPQQSFVSRMWSRMAGEADHTETVRDVIDDSAKFVLNSYDTWMSRTFDSTSEVKCFLVMSVRKGGLGVSGRYGNGVASCRIGGNNWSAPLFVKLYGANVGPQLGYEEIELINEFTSADGLMAYLNNGLAAGFDGTVVIPKLGGIYAEAASSVSSSNGKIAEEGGTASVSDARGAALGVSFAGTYITDDSGINGWIYPGLTPEKILTSTPGQVWKTLPQEELEKPAAKALKIVEPFRKALAKISAR